MKVTVCIGSYCHVKGSRQVVEELQFLTAENKLQDKVDLGGKFCMGECTNKGEDGVSVTIDGKQFHVKPEDTKEFFNKEILPRAKA